MSDIPKPAVPELDDDGVVIEVPPPEFAWETFAESPDEARRAYVMEAVPFEASVDPKAIIDTWHQAEHWLRTGVPLHPIDNDPMPGRLRKKLGQHG